MNLYGFVRKQEEESLKIALEMSKQDISGTNEEEEEENDTEEASTDLIGKNTILKGGRWIPRI